MNPVLISIGQQFGSLTVQTILPRHNKSRQTCYECKCACGEFSTVTSYNLRHNRIVSCGCKRKRKGKASGTWKGYECISGSYWKSVKTNAAKRKRIFDITIEYAYSVLAAQDFKCALTGWPIDFSYRKVTASLDRIDSSLDYIEGNIQWLNKDVNRSKQEFSTEYFQSLCKAVVANV